ncbi:putative chromatin assembly factor 1 subunit Rlf2p [[Candida] railenensis]|uniref:Chromatin assembly factor 1 subunit Rlf2p n=1 Tax=[Candida] railenensis TaxID=45579 RepID=A0A9P0QV51_9ASCO|nr:putative chromatin assembly factor 1 subunit Rlf2p [[Candida] railenensis]
MTKSSPSGTPEKEGKRDVVEDVVVSSPKRLKLDSDAASDKPEEEKAPTKKQLEKIERQKQRELEKVERDRKKEEERIKKEEDRRLREEERKKKLEEKELEKESRRKKLEEEKIERDRKKEEERLKKLAEREEKEKIRLEKKLKLEEEKRKADEEKRKAEEAKKRAEEAKERSQMKISSFFTPKKRVSSEESEPLTNSIGNDNSDTPSTGATSTASSTSSSTASTNATSTSTSPSKSNNRSSPSKNSHICTYDRVFLPFFQKKNVTMPKSSTLSKEDLAIAKDSFDSIISIKREENQHSYENFMKNCTFKIQSKTSNSSVETTKSEMSTEKIMAALNSNDATENEIYDMIERIPPIKYLQFYENSKPPYIGTWCSEEHLKIKFPANDPFFKIPAGVDYDYDSDFDWNEEEDGEEGEGEDIDNDEDDEEEEDVMDEEEEDFEDFVDSNGEGQKKKKRFVGPLISLSIWNDGNDNDFFETMKYEPVNEKIQFPINPTFGYWSRKKVEKDEDREESKAVDSNNVKVATQQQSEEKPSLPMSSSVGAAVSATAAAHTTITDIIGSNSAPNVLVAQKPKIKDSKAIFELLKFVEENNDFTIGTLVELSHKKFKSFTKALIKHTIKDIATYNKKTGNWEVNQEIKEKLSQGVNA